MKRLQVIISAVAACLRNEWIIVALFSRSIVVVIAHFHGSIVLLFLFFFSFVIAASMLSLQDACVHIGLARDALYGGT